MIKNISFDLWLTLIKSNPEFKPNRAKFFAEMYNPLGFSYESIFDIITCTDKVCDRFNEQKGCKISTIEMYRRLLMKLHYPLNDVNNTALLNIKDRMDKLFLEYPPIIINNEVYNILEQLYKSGIILNIASNTGFIEGGILKIILKKLKLYDYFSFFIFSDEINASKPSNIFFEQVYSKIKNKKNEVLHVGDNLKTDYYGASNFGFQALHIKNGQLDKILPYILLKK